jgi:hypothetical protein
MKRDSAVGLARSVWRGSPSALGASAERLDRHERVEADVFPAADDRDYIGVVKVGARPHAIPPNFAWRAAGRAGFKIMHQRA